MSTAVGRKPGPRTRRMLPLATAFAAAAVTFAAFFIAAGAPAPLLPIYQAKWPFAAAAGVITQLATARHTGLRSTR